MNTTTSDIQPRRVDVVTAPAALPRFQSVQPSLWYCLGPALLSALLLWMCYFPLAWGWLGWVALVPFLSLARARATPRRIYLCAWACGSAFFWPVLFWMPVNHLMLGAWTLLAVYCSLYLPAALWLIRLLDRRTPLPLILSVPIAWTALEFARSWLLTGFAWYYLGHTQHTFLSMIQIADLGGVYLVSFLVAAVNAWLFDVLFQIPNLRELCRWEEPRGTDARSASLGAASRRVLIYEPGFLLLALLGTWIYGTWRIQQDSATPGLTVTLLQTNIPQKLRDSLADDAERGRQVADLTRQYAELCKRAIEYHPRTDLIIWPETSYTPWYETSPKVPLDRVPAEFRHAAWEIRRHLTEDLLRSCPTNHLLGLNSMIIDEDGRAHNYNSALLLQRNGTFPTRYDKIHRVPFGEFVPFRDWPIIGTMMNWVAPYDFDYSIRPGQALTRFDVEKYKFGVLICYEDTDPFLARRYVRTEEDGPPVDFLVNISNDGWFDGSSEHDEHLAISRFRAIECRRAVVRSVNQGISAVIDGNGRVLAARELPPAGVPHFWLAEGDGSELPVREWEKFKKTPGVLRAQVPIDARESFYARNGDWLPGGCWAVLGCVMVGAFVQRRRRAAV